MIDLPLKVGNVVLSNLSNIKGSHVFAYHNHSGLSIDSKEAIISKIISYIYLSLTFVPELLRQLEFT